MGGFKDLLKSFHSVFVVVLLFTDSQSDRKIWPKGSKKLPKAKPNFELKLPKITQGFSCIEV